MSDEKKNLGNASFSFNVNTEAFRYGVADAQNTIFGFPVREVQGKIKEWEYGKSPLLEFGIYDDLFRVPIKITKIRRQEIKLAQQFPGLNKKQIARLAQVVKKKRNEPYISYSMRIEKMLNTRFIHALAEEEDRMFLYGR
jgi:hypothetical protein